MEEGNTQAPDCSIGSDFVPQMGDMTGRVMKTGKFKSLGFRTHGFRVRGFMQLESGVYEMEITMLASWGP